MDSKEAKANGSAPVGTKSLENGSGPAEERREDWTGWVRLSDVLPKPDPLFENILFLEGYDLSSNIHIVVASDLAVVDPGNDYTAFLTLFGSSGYSPSDIHKVVLTHGHSDHAAGTLELFRYPSIRENPNFEIIMHRDGPEELKRIVRYFGAVLTEVMGGEILDLGGYSWEVIHTPGHTRDGICLFHQPTGTLLSGDMVLPYGMAMPDKHAGGRMDQYLAALRLLMRLNIKNVLPGHGPPVIGKGTTVLEGSYLAVLYRILGLTPGPELSWFDVASTAAQSGLPEESVYCCSKSMAEDEKDIRPIKLRALCFNELGKFNEAICDFNLLGKRSPAELEDPFTAVGRGYALMGLGLYNDACCCFDAALNSSPLLEDALMYKGFSLFLGGREDESMEIDVFRAAFEGKFKDELVKSVNPPLDYLRGV